MVAWLSQDRTGNVFPCEARAKDDKLVGEV